MTAQHLDTGTADLLAELQDGVLTLTLNRPDARNAMSKAMNQALQEQLAQAEFNPAVKCLVLTGAGQGFCAGGDVKGMAAAGDGTVGQLNQKQLEYSGYIMKSSGALLAIINDILDLASIDTDAMELEVSDVDIRRTIEAAAQGLQDRLAESSIHLQIVAMDNVGTFRADAKRLRQVLFNLLSNAIGFSTPGQTVTLAAMRRGDAIVFKVTDQGRGIPAEVLSQVFDRFRTHTIGSRHKGVGLGLSIVRAFVELHGGEVQIQSAPGEGTTVTCIFPETGIAQNRSAEVA